MAGKLVIEVDEESFYETKKKMLQLKSIANEIDKLIEGVQSLAYFLFLITFLIGFLLGITLTLFLS